MDEERGRYWPAETDGPSSELFDTLADVLREEEEKARLREGAPVPWGDRHRGLLLVSLVLLTLLSGFLWVFPPAWISGEALPSLSPELADAGLRMEIYLQAVRVRDFQARERRLPNSLEEAGDPYSVVRYERLDANRFRLRVQGAPEDIVYESTQPLGEFLGDALRIIEANP